MIKQDDSPNRFIFEGEVLDLKDKIEKILVEGYGHIPSEFYLNNDDLKELHKIQESYVKIQINGLNKGGRNRAYHRFTFSEDKLINSTSSYAQSAEYNEADGGKKRNFPEIDETILNTKLLRKLLMLNIKICEETKLVEFKNMVSIGIHQIRYFATDERPAYSTPAWLHRDDETVVFVHFLGQSSSAIGGTNYIAKSPEEIIQVLHLTEPLETLVLSKKHLHSLSPIGVKSGKKDAYRDVLIVTFESDKDFKERLENCF
jgi:hypothetical protein